MRDMASQQRTDRIQIPVNAKEKKEFFKLAERAKLTLSAFGRLLFYKALEEAGKKSEAA
jgi:hypothetical protein